MYFLSLYTLLFVSLQVSAQLTVTTGITPNNLVQNVLVGEGVTITNVTFQGSLSAIGRFQTGATPTNLGLSSGIVLGTGAVNNTIGSPASNFASSSLGTGGYSLLTNIAGTTTYDAAILQFNFVPQSDTIKFRYVFGSEEYHEFVNSTFNDAFGFFITGPNPLGPAYNNRNIALIPGTNIPVTINNVNNGYSGSPCAFGPCMNCSHFVDNCYGNSIIYDAFTKVLTAWAVVVPCQTYTIIIAIADGGDSSYDSAVFLEANSFSSNAVGISTSTSNPAAGDDAIEGCNNAIIDFCIPQALSQNHVVNFTIGGTAINGVDYQTIPNSVTIPAGQTCTQLQIIPFADGIIEGTETVILTVQTSPCAQEIVTINILDYVDMNVSATGETSFCQGNTSPVPIGVNTSNGLPPYSYNWNNGLPSTQNHNVNPAQTTTYNVTVSDACGHTASSNVTISVIDNAQISIAPSNPTICLGNDITLTASGGASYLWSNNGTTPSITVSPTQTTTYSVTGTDSFGCTGTTSTIVNVEPELSVSIVANPLEICIGGNVSLTANGANNYLWSTGQQGQSVTVSPTQTTTYTVTGTDNTGCSGTASITITVFPSLSISITPTEPQICEGSTISLTASGASTYNWSNGNSIATNTVSPIETTTYSVTGTDDNNCTGSASITVIVNPLPDVISIADLTEVCLGTPVQIGATGANSYIWNNGNNTDNFTDTPAQTTTYSVTGTDINGCTGTSQVIVEVFQNLTLLITPNNPNICNGETVTLQVTSNGTNPSFIWDTGDTTPTLTLSPEITTTYIVNAEDQYGCTGSSSTTITVSPIPEVDFTANPLSGCVPVNVVFTSVSDANNSFLWDFGNGLTSTQNNPSHLYNYPGNFTVSLHVNSPNNCSNSIVKPNYINVYPVPFADFKAIPPVATEDEPTISFIDESIGATTWLWSFEDGNLISYSNERNPVYTYSNLGKHNVELRVENQWGCSDVTQKVVYIKPITTFYIPNAFSPNGDGFNDFFLPYGYNVDEENYLMTIYDRWGKIVFQTTNIHEGWDGKMQKGGSKVLPIGVYSYVIHASFNNLKEVFKGTITLFY